LHEVASWPAWELSVLEHYLAREPAPVERVEVMLAQLTAYFVKVHQSKGGSERKISDFLPYLKAWPEESDGRYNEVDKQVLAELL
jgi:hypothetical protein